MSMNKCEWIGHQGDVNVYRVDAFPEGEIQKDDQTTQGVLAYGEATGHAHQIDENDLRDSVEVFKIITKATQLVALHVKKPITISHGRFRGYTGTEPDQDYHKPIVLNPGKYVTGITPEYDPFERVVRRVAD